MLQTNITLSAHSQFVPARSVFYLFNFLKEIICVFKSCLLKNQWPIFYAGKAVRILSTHAQYGDNSTGFYLIGVNIGAIRNNDHLSLSEWNFFPNVPDQDQIVFQFP